MINYHLYSYTNGCGTEITEWLGANASEKHGPVSESWVVVREGGQENCTIPICGRRNRGPNAVDLLLPILSSNNNFISP